METMSVRLRPSIRKKKLSDFHEIRYTEFLQDRQFTYNVTLRRVCESLLPRQSSKSYKFVCGCVRAHGCARMGAQARRCVPACARV